MKTPKYLWLFLLAAGCGGGGVSVGNSRPAPLEGEHETGEDGSADEEALRLQLVLADFQVKGLDGAGEGAPYWVVSTQTKSPLVVTEATAQVASLAFRPSKPIDCEAYARESANWGGRVAAGCAPDELKFSGPFALDLIRGESTPPMSSLALPAGAYASVLLEFNEESTRPAMRLQGVYQDRKGRPVLLEPPLPARIGFDAGAVAVAGGLPATWAVEISVADWFMGTENEIVRCRTNNPNQAPDEDEAGGNSESRCDAAEALLESNLIPASRVKAHQ